MKDLFLLRRAYLQQQASLLHELQDLEMQLNDRDNSISRCTADASAGECAGFQDSYEISKCRRQLQEAYITYKGIIFDGVCTPWQGAMAVIAIFPHAPQALTRVVDALAEEAGGPCAASIQLAVRHFSIADEASYNVNSVQNSIYRNKMHGQPRRPGLVV